MSNNGTISKVKGVKKHYLTAVNLKRDHRGRYWEIPLKDRVGESLKIHEKGWMRPKGTLSTRDPRRYRRIRAVWAKQSEKDYKVIVIEELKLQTGVREIRFGYYTVTGMANKVRRGEWIWGQSALIAPWSDILSLLRFAARKGMLSL